MRTRKWIRWLGFAATNLLVWLPAANGQEAGPRGARLETLDQYTRLHIPLTTGSTFRLLSGKSGEATLVVDRVATGALEALGSLSDGRVQQVRVKPLGLDQAEIHVYFRTPATESFAYQQGNTLVLDLWQGSKTASAEAVKPAPVLKAKKVAPVTQASSRTPASKLAAKAESPQVDPLKIEQDLFLKFILPMPELAVKAKDGGFDLPPVFDLESRWKFEKGDKSTEDGKGFEFAKSLFQAKKYGLCLKTIEIVLRDHPDTDHSDELEFLRALAYRNLGEANKADFLVARSEKILQELAARRDEDAEPLPFARLIVLYFAQKELQAHNWLQALQQLEFVSSVTKPKDPDFPYVQMLLAETYSQVKQPRRAERLYRFLTERFPKHALGKEAAYRIADLLAIEKNYARVTEEGEAAIRAYPDYEKTRAEVLFHVGEAYFWRGQYANAEKYLRRFTELASAQTNASLAWVRIGEIAEVHRRNLGGARQAYLHAKNNYPFSKGDLVATVRLARIDLPTEKDPNFVVRTLNELLLDKTVDAELKRMAELTLADYMLATGEIEKEIELASAGMAQTDGLVYNLYKNAYQKGLYARLSLLTKKKKYPEALALFEKERKWLEQHGADTFRTVSEVYRGLGLFASANQMMERYKKELFANGRVPASAANAHLSREKAANSFARGAYEETLEAIGENQDAESQYLRAVSHYRLGRKREAFVAADRLLPLLKGAKSEFTDDKIENVGEILIERDDKERDYPRMEREVAALAHLCAKENDRLTFAAADALWYQKRHKEALPAYREALEKFPKSNRADRARYNAGISLVALGKRDDAVKLLTELRDGSQGVWAESAKQELELIEWEKKYSSVLRTLPPAGLGIAN